LHILYDSLQEVNQHDVTMACSVATLIKPNGFGVQLDIPEGLTAQEFIDLAELSLEQGKPYSFVVTRDNEVIKVEGEEIKDFSIMAGDELAITSQNCGG